MVWHGMVWYAANTRGADVNKDETNVHKVDGSF